MNSQFEALLNVVAQDPWDVPPDLRAALDAEPEAGRLPEPWTGWTVIALASYAGRKAWAQRLVDGRILPSLASRQGREVEPQDLVARGIVPGMPAWEFALDRGIGLLTHRLTGERLHVDLLHGPRFGSRWDFFRYLGTNRRPGPAARRVAALHPTARAVDLALDEIAGAGLLRDVSGGDLEREGDVELDEALLGLCDPADELQAALSDPARRIWLCARLGDWMAARGAARDRGEAGIVALTDPRSRRCLQLRQDSLRRLAARSGPSGALLHAMIDAGVGDLPAHLRRAIEVPGEATPAALELIGDDPAYVPQVAALFERAGVEAPLSHLRGACAGYLSRVGADAPGVIERLATGPGEDLGLASLLALEHAPGLAIGLVRRALRSRSAGYRLTAAAALAALDREWTRRELRAVLDESDDPDVTVQCRTALRESRDPGARRAADEWEDSHPGTEGAPRPSDRDLDERVGGCERVLLDRMCELRQRLKGCKLDDPPAVDLDS
jgi:hypothetical protein